MNIYKNRRESLMTSLNNGDIVIVFAAENPPGFQRFDQNKNFLYLTGLTDLPEAIYVCSKNADKTNEMLFIQRNIEDKIVWDGAKMYPNEATQICGIEKVRFLDEFEEEILFTLHTGQKVFLNYTINRLKKPLSKPLFFVSKVRDRFLHLTYSDITSLIKPLRQIKDETEIANIRKAIEVTGFGLNSIFTTAKSGMYEYELEAMIQFDIRKRGLKNFGFAPIIGCGINAATLHYHNNDTQIQKGQLVLCDVGASYNGYSADITRTFPIDKKFTTRQAAIYTEVLNCQKTIITMIKPGVTMTQLNEKTAELLGASLVKLGLITDPADYRKYYMHSIGHQLGMDCHDIGDRNATLVAGMVLTVEPGIYIPEENIGIRIEDDILVTKKGHENLSIGIPKEIGDLEGIRKNVK
jgi:Xaa-Pro aminopeptidase